MKVFIIAALTVDGFIGRDANHLADWTSPEDKAHFSGLTREAGVMVMGSRTFATIGRALPGRRMLVYTTRPGSITADGIETVNEEPNMLVARLAQQGVNGVAICGGASIYTLFLRAGVVDELYLTIEPLLFGQGVTLFSGELESRLERISSEPLNKDTLLLHYKVLH